MSGFSAPPPSVLAKVLCTRYQQLTTGNKVEQQGICMVLNYGQYRCASFKALQLGVLLNDGTEKSGPDQTLYYSKEQTYRGEVMV